ncbi:MAG: hypothetical protein PWQ82_674 [Thermosediminibacterales bacterium]|nr:hypothetical protein [Thermosediminibacterales bacterium]MDK2836782.1 hypothetical protein [Thermosediminibacterales bacterium]
MPLSTIILLVVALLIYFGAAHRVLDRLRLNDKTAFLFIGAMILGSFLPNIPLVGGLSINIGGGIIPIILAVYLILKAESAKEKTRSIVASLITAAAVYGAAKLLPSDPGNMIISPTYLFAILAGIVAYIFGRSRRGAFVAGIMGIVLSDIIYAVEIAIGNTPGATTIGGAGIFDSVVISGLIAVGLAEVIGEAREKLQGGTKKTEYASFFADKSTESNEKEKDEKAGEYCNEKK